MDELGVNKIAGAVLATALGVMLIREIPHMVTHSNYPDAPVYQVGPVEVAGPTDAAPLPFPQETWVAAMDATRGAKVFKRCTSCHNADSGGKNSTGPNLYGIVGNAAGKHAGFKYSSAMTSSGITWSYEELDGFLKKPAKHLKGTNMSFAGIKKDTDRAAVIEYLRIAADAPIAQPAAAIVEAAVEGDLLETVQEIITETAPETHGNGH